MKEIHIQDPHRQKHFEFFLGFEQPHFNVCAPIEITDFRRWQKAGELPFNLCVVYFVSKAANAIPEFRWRIREGRIVEHAQAHPSFTTPTQGTDVFSFCTVPYTPNFSDFIAEGVRIRDLMYTDPSLEDEEGRDDYFFLSSVPWIHFTSVGHAMGCPREDSVPRITWGKFEEREEKLMMPLSIQAHHALVDGGHTGRLFQSLEAAFARPQEFVES